MELLHSIAFVFGPILVMLVVYFSIWKVSKMLGREISDGAKIFLPVIITFAMMFAAVSLEMSALMGGIGYFLASMCVFALILVAASALVSEATRRP